MRALRFRSVRFVACATVMLVVTSGCQLLQSATRYASAPGSVDEPFWCDPIGGTALSPRDCQGLSGELDWGLLFAHNHFTAVSAYAAGATSTTYSPGVGTPFTFTPPQSQFDFRRPDTLLYDSASPTGQVAGLEWNVASASAPAGFRGGNDVWNEVTEGHWRLRVWLLRPFQNEPNVFATSHPCLGAGGPIYDVTNACYTSTHINPFKILVSDDDGYAAAGIDAAVEALRLLPIDTDILVSAPLVNQSATGGKTSPPPLSADLFETTSHYPAWAVDGFPADSVIYALDTLHSSPDLLVSGINQGQNIGPLITLSGTVGAARVGGRAEIPAVALSQGLTATPDYPSGAAALTAWVNDFLLGRVGTGYKSVTSINIPTCATGSIRGTAVLPTATAFNGRAGGSNCASTVNANTFVDDIDGFNNGYITVSEIGVGP